MRPSVQYLAKNIAWCYPEGEKKKDPPFGKKTEFLSNQ